MLVDKVITAQDGRHSNLYYYNSDYPSLKQMNLLVFGYDNIFIGDRYNYIIKDVPWYGNSKRFEYLRDQTE